MDTVLKSFSGIFILLLLTSVSVGLIGATICANTADQYYSKATKKISVSNFSIDVIEECKKEAKERGYVLEVTSSEVNDTGKRVGQGKLLYDFKVPIIGIHKQYKIESNIW
ncbi:MAG: hypothetical protein K6F30_08475 [Lachnospiraceae bacterium]|nr:hypothetical protein [Lachnospiraceae bacterium]